MTILEIIKSFKQIDKKVLKIVRNGLKCSFVFCLIACLFLATYTMFEDANTYYIGISLLKSGLFFIVGFIICGMAFIKIINE